MHTGIAAAISGAVCETMRARRGEMMMVIPGSIIAGSWKQRDFPKEVAAERKMSWEAREARMTSRWRGLRLMRIRR